AQRDATRTVAPTPRRLPSPFRAGSVAGADGRVRRFVRETRSELKKVVWPTREEAINLTIIVIVVSIAVGIVLGGVDYVFKLLFEFLVGL
ncbi:MAG: preprotein translocase subunit SecE, partial [Chloroflexota bacterium]